MNFILWCKYGNRAIRHCCTALRTPGLKSAYNTCIVPVILYSTVPTLHWPGCFIWHSRRIISRSAYHKGSSDQQGPETSGSQANTVWQGWPNSETRVKFGSRTQAWIGWHGCLKADTDASHEEESFIYNTQTISLWASLTDGSKEMHAAREPRFCDIWYIKNGKILQSILITSKHTCFPDAFYAIFHTPLA